MPISGQAEPAVRLLKRDRYSDRIGKSGRVLRDGSIDCCLNRGGLWIACNRTVESWDNRERVSAVRSSQDAQVAACSAEATCQYPIRSARCASVANAGPVASAYWAVVLATTPAYASERA